MDRRTFLVYGKNGSTVEISAAFPIASGTIIALCLLAAVAYNMLVIAAILTNNRLRTSPCHVALVYIAVVCLLDSSTNESFAFGFLYDSRSEECGVSAMTFHFFLLGHVAALGLLLLQRVLELQEHEASLRMYLIAVLASWVFSLILASILVGAADKNFFPNRNACSAVSTRIWPSIVYFLGFLISWSITATSFFLCIRSISSHPSDISDASQRSTVQRNDNRLAFLILSLYLVLLLPETISVIVNLFVSPTFEPDPWIDPRIRGQVRSVTTNDLEPLFVYSRYMYNVVVPVTILLTDGQTRRQGKQLFCCRWNEVSSLEWSTIPVSQQLNEEFQLPRHLYTTRVPVLFATAEGIHLAVPRRTGSASSSTAVGTSNFTLKTIFCDLKPELERKVSSLQLSQSTGEVKEVGGSSVEKSHVVGRNVRFSSRVEEIVVESGVYSSSVPGSLSDTHTVDVPLVVKHEEI